MYTRTDLVCEQKEMHTENINGAEYKEELLNDTKIETVTITDNTAAKTLSKPKGKYITVSFDNIINLSDTKDIEDAIVKALNSLLPQKRGSILAVGLGNGDITPDAIGPMTVNGLLATRHIENDLAISLGLGNIKKVSTLIPGVLGKTGIESVEIIKGTVERTKPDAVIVIDALAARRTERLCRTVQLCDSGINPGSGVHNSRKEISQNVLGVPVIAIGIPTVVDVASLVEDFTQNAPPKHLKNMMVTPKDIDLLIKRCSELLAISLNTFLQPDLDREIIYALV